MPADITKLEEKIDKTESAGIVVSEALGGVRLENMIQVMELAKMLAVSKQAVPPHCRGEPGLCLAVCIQALEWKFSPFAVAQKSYVVNDKLVYEAQLIHAVIESRAPLQKRLRCEYTGEGTDLACKVIGLFKGEKDPHEYESPKIKDIKTQNSPLWKADPKQQLWYYSSRAWARKWCPDVLLGIYSEDEIAEAEPMKDITPARPDLASRLPGAGGRGFQEGHVERALEHKPTEVVSTTLVAEGGVGAAPVVADGETIAVSGGTGTPSATTKTGPRKKKETPAPAPAPEPEKAAEQVGDTETPLARGRRLLMTVQNAGDVLDLRRSIMEELAGNPADLEAWDAECGARVKDFG